MNQRKASSPCVRLVINRGKRDEKQVRAKSDCPTPASRYLWVGIQTGVTIVNKNKPTRTRLDQKVKDRGLAFRPVTKDSPPLNPVESLTLRVRQTNRRNEVTRPALSAPKLQAAEKVTSRKQWTGEIPRKANAESNVSDMLTRGR